MSRLGGYRGRDVKEDVDRPVDLQSRCVGGDGAGDGHGGDAVRVLLGEFCEDGLIAAHGYDFGVHR